MIDVAIIILIALLGTSVVAAMLAIPDEAAGAPHHRVAALSAGEGVDSETVWRRENYSILLPLGWLLMALGLIGSICTWTVDLVPSGELGNVDTIMQRGMFHAGALAVLIIGIVLACTGQLINEIRRAG
ncbi:hypothetical protein OVA07_00585 [Novosphingobium sp. SL115]|uniref:hypothetical protein n=1 Tax=Novosphingobium sp. SL115 TaxID=2995150 RepID=UPI0022760D16|nr:hypothetical protein [Novosphingobium sp. SL115]MCY1669509.1 hypothetical protein [Novosphingobium sp. SL115]